MKTTIIVLALLSAPNPPTNVGINEPPVDPERYKKCLLWPVKNEQGWAIGFKIVCEE